MFVQIKMRKIHKKGQAKRKKKNLDANVIRMIDKA